MKEYYSSLQLTEENFHKLCEKVEKVFPTAKKHQLLIDVDGSLVRPYDTPQGHITVIGSYDEFDPALYVRSEFEFDPNI